LPPPAGPGGGGDPGTGHAGHREYGCTHPRGGRRLVRDARAAKSRPSSGRLDAPGWTRCSTACSLNAPRRRASGMRATSAAGGEPITPGQCNVRARLGGTGLTRNFHAQLAAPGSRPRWPVAEVRVEDTGVQRSPDRSFTVLNLPASSRTWMPTAVRRRRLRAFYGSTTDRFADSSRRAILLFHSYWSRPPRKAAGTTPSGWLTRRRRLRHGHFVRRATTTRKTSTHQQPSRHRRGILPIRSSFYCSARTRLLSTPAQRGSMRPPGELPHPRVTGRGCTPTLSDVHLVSLAVNNCQILTDGPFRRQHEFEYPRRARARSPGA